MEESILQEIDEWAKQLECPKIQKDLEGQLKDLVGQLNMLESRCIRVAVAGAINTGKSSLINALVGADLEVSILASKKTTRLVFELDGRKDDDTVLLESKWMKDHNLEIWELSSDELPLHPSEFDWTKHFGRFDVCIYLLNTMAPWSRVDDSNIKMCDQLSIPTLVVMAYADRVDEREFPEIEQYVAQCSRKYKLAHLLQHVQQLPVEQLGPCVQGDLLKMIEKDNFSENRKAAKEIKTKVFMSHALDSMIGTCKKEQHRLVSQKDEIKQSLQQKRESIEKVRRNWDDFCLELRKDKRKIVQEISQYKDEMITELNSKNGISLLLNFRKLDEDNQNKIKYCIDLVRNDVNKIGEKIDPIYKQAKVDYDKKQMNFDKELVELNEDHLGWLQWVGRLLKRSVKEFRNPLKLNKQQIKEKIEEKWQQGEDRMLAVYDSIIDSVYSDRKKWILQRDEDFKNELHKNQVRWEHDNTQLEQDIARIRQLKTKI